MTDVEIIAGNKLIAVFNDVPFSDRDFTDDRSVGGNADAVRYHRDWNWLMPLIEKISSIEFDRQECELPFGGTEVVIHTHYPRTFGMLSEEGKPMFRFNCGRLFTADTLIEAAWRAVVDFIHSHNEQVVSEIKEALK